MKNATIELNTSGCIGDAPTIKNRRRSDVYTQAYTGDHAGRDLQSIKEPEELSIAHHLVKIVEGMIYFHIVLCMQEPRIYPSSVAEPKGYLPEPMGRRCVFARCVSCGVQDISHCETEETPCYNKFETSKADSLIRIYLNLNFRRSYYVNDVLSDRFYSSLHKKINFAYF